MAAVCLVGAARADAFEPVHPAEITAPALRFSSVPTPEQVFEAVSDQAAVLARAPYAGRPGTLPVSFRDLDYDGYRKLRPKQDAAVWGEAGNSFAVLPLPRGGLFNDPVRLWLVDSAEPTRITDEAAFFDFVDFPQATQAEREQLGVSGWRAIKHPGQAGVGYEAAIFQGGVYFRAVAKNLVYGASARALAIGTGSSAREEFPHFTDFWIFHPTANSETLTAIALMDTPSAAAAYRFDIKPGVGTAIAVEANIHPRVELSTFGVAPLSSMYQHGATDHAGASDWRAEVHDSDGLSILTASGERIWRPLINPAGLQISTFAANSVRGFGLLQRAREFSSYGDLEAKYELRPSVWIEPGGDWGEGEITLVEIPTPTEYNDNIVAFWRPARAWAPGEAHRIAYELDWTAQGPANHSIATVAATRAGAAPGAPGLRRFVIDFASDHHFAAAASAADVWSTAGAIRNLQLSDGPDAGSRRLTFDLDPQSAAVAELHAALRDETSQLTETWLFRWTPE